MEEQKSMNQDKNQGFLQNEQGRQIENKQVPSKVVLRVKRKANEDPLEQLIIEGELTTQKKQKPNPLFGINFLEKMLNDLTVQENQKKEKEQVQTSNLFNLDGQQSESSEKKQYVLTLVNNDNDALKYIKEAKQAYAESNRKKQREKQIGKNRHQTIINDQLIQNKQKLLELTVDEASKEVKVEKPKFDEEESDEDGDYAYYQVEERKQNENNSMFQNIGSLLSKEMNPENIMRVQSGFIHLIQNHNPELFEGEFGPYNKDDFSDRDSQDSNRESADNNDYPDEEQDFDDDEDKEYNHKNQDYDDEDYDDYAQEDLKKKSKKKKNVFQNSLHGIYLGQQSSDDNSNKMEKEEDDDDNGDDYEDDFNKKYNNYYHKRYENDFNDDDYED